MHMSSVLTLKGGGTYPFSTVWNKTAGYTADGFAFHDIFCSSPQYLPHRNQGNIETLPPKSISRVRLRRSCDA